jgi:cysteine-rich repeat protein
VPLPRCGNGILQSGEQCDDGNTTGGDGCSATCEIEQEILDCGDAAASLTELWPPNHQFAEVSIVGVTAPNGGPVSITITGITQDEPLEGPGDGNTCPDALGVGTSTAKLRAERAGTPSLPGDGRVYHVSFTAASGAGGECNGTVTVCVPHDQRPGHACIDGGALVDSTGPCP